jgi:hypothetical protein
LEVLEYLLGRQKYFVGRQVESQECHILARSPAAEPKLLGGKYLRRKIKGKPPAGHRRLIH